MSTIQCNIVSPEGELFSGEVEMLSAEGGAGEIAITPRHAPLLTNLKPGPVKLTLEGGEEEVFFASGGFLEVQPGEVTLLTDVAERADDIDSAAAERAKELAERELEDQKADMDYSLAAANLAEAAASAHLRRAAQLSVEGACRKAQAEEKYERAGSGKE